VAAARARVPARVARDGGRCGVLPVRSLPSIIKDQFRDKLLYASLAILPL
jgi:hypothetical protein